MSIWESGDIVRIKTCRVRDLIGELAVVEHLFWSAGYRWVVLAPWLGEHAGWGIDTYVTQPHNVEPAVLTPSS